MENKRYQTEYAGDSVMENLWQNANSTILELSSRMRLEKTSTSKKVNLPKTTDAEYTVESF